MTVTRIGRYEVVEELGAGAMAVVYKAVDPLIGRTVAIKTIKFDSNVGLEKEELRQRLYREAQSAGNLSHPNIVTIYDIGEEGAVAYIAMEFIEGESLQAWMSRNPVPPLEQTLSIIEPIASGLDYAAARGITHRDIKPGNILLTPDLKAKIADFGIAKFSTSKFTQTGAVMGTPAYMSPEQAMGRTLDGRSDIFSLGVIFYEMLTGERPFSGANATTIMYKILHEEPIPPGQLNVTLPKSCDYLISRMLAKDPDQRYQSCAELIHDLRECAIPGRKAPSVRKSIKTARVPGMAPGPAAGGRRYLMASIAVVLLAVIGVLSYFLIRQLRNPASSTPNQGDSSPAAAEPGRAGQSAVPPGAKTAVTKDQGKQAAAEKPGRAEIRLEFSGDGFPVTLYDGTRRLEELSPSLPSVEVASGDHQFRIASKEVFLNHQLAAVRLKAADVFSIPVPGLGSAYIELPDDAYETCDILIDEQRILPPYPASIARLAAGNHSIKFRWSGGRYAGKEISSTFISEASRHYRLFGEPQTGRVSVQQINR